MGVGDGSDVSVRIFFRHPKGERAPAAAEFEDVLPIPQIRMCAGLQQRVGLSLDQCIRGGVVEAAGILTARAEYEAKECLWQLVMLRIGVCSVFRDRVRDHGGGELVVDITGRHCHPSMRAAYELGDAEAGHGIGKRQPFEQAGCCGDHAHPRNSWWGGIGRGGMGKKALVRAW